MSDYLVNPMGKVSEFSKGLRVIFWAEQLKKKTLYINYVLCVTCYLSLRTEDPKRNKVAKEEPWVMRVG